MGYKKASVTFGVTLTTLERKVSLGRKQTMFSTSEEGKLAIYLKVIEGILFGLTSKELRNLAFQLAQKNVKHHPFDKDKGEADMDWFRGFMKRHHNLSLRKPDVIRRRPSFQARPEGSCSENKNVLDPCRSLRDRQSTPKIVKKPYTNQCVQRNYHPPPPK
jgi:hypothetical protein